MFGRLACAYFASMPGAVKDKAPSLLCIIGCEASKKKKKRTILLDALEAGNKRIPGLPGVSTLIVISQYAKEGIDVCSVTPLPFFKLNNKLKCVSAYRKNHTYLTCDRVC